MATVISAPLGELRPEIGMDRIRRRLVDFLPMWISVKLSAGMTPDGDNRHLSPFHAPARIRETGKRNKKKTTANQREFK